MFQFSFKIYRGGNMELFLKYSLISVLIFGVGFATIFIVPASFITPIVVIMLLGNSIHWIMYGVRKDKRKH